MVRLKEKTALKNRIESEIFQFLMVRLKENINVNANATVN